MQQIVKCERVGRLCVGGCESSSWGEGCSPEGTCREGRHCRMKGEGGEGGGWVLPPP